MRIVLFMLLLAASALASASVDVMTFRDAEQEQAYRQLTAQLRCPKCQNNSIADSSAMIAVDMRQKVYDLLQAGNSPQQVVDYMVARYGNFVTYDPPLTLFTALLWLLPAAVVVAGCGAIYARSRKRVSTAPQPPQPERTAAPRNLWWLTPCVALALGIGVYSYLHTGGYRQVMQMQAAAAATPALLARLENPRAAPLDLAELRQLELGLRTRLLQGEGDRQQSIVLSRITALLATEESH